MANYYVDPAAGGANNGSSWADAWTSLQSAADTAVAGDTVWCRGTQILTATIDFDTNSGSAASGYIKFIGCNAAGAVDGTPFTLNGNGVAAFCIGVNGKYFIWIENFRLTGAAWHGFSRLANANWGGWVFVNVTADTCGHAGFDLYYSHDPPATFIRCRAHGNGPLGGFYKPYFGCRYVACMAYDNTGQGFYGAASPHNGDICVGCTAYSNSLSGFRTDQAPLLVHCVSDENDDHGIDVTNDPAIIIGCRLTDNGDDGTGYGINVAADKLAVVGWSFLLDNTDGATNGTVVEISTDGVGTNAITGTEGYTDGAGRDYNLTSEATLRSEPIELN